MLDVCTNRYHLRGVVDENVAHCTGPISAGEGAPEPGPGNRVMADDGSEYELGMPLDLDVHREDAFGAWPATLPGGNSAYLQVGRHLHGTVSDFCVRLGVGADGTRLSRRDAAPLLYRHLQQINALEVREVMVMRGKKLELAEPLPVEKDVIREEHVAAWAKACGVDPALVRRLNRVHDLTEQLNAACKEAHDDMFGDKPGSLAQLTTPIAIAMRDRRLKVLASADARAVQVQAEKKLERQQAAAVAAASASAMEEQQALLEKKILSLDAVISALANEVEELSGQQTSVAAQIELKDIQIRARRINFAQQIASGLPFDRLEIAIVTSLEEWRDRLELERLSLADRIADRTDLLRDAQRERAGLGSKKVVA